MKKRVISPPASFPVLLVLALLALTLNLVGCGQNRPPRPLPASDVTPQKPDVSAQAGTAVEGIRFENVAQSAGLHFHWPHQPRPMRNQEAFGCGCAFLDYDNDGWQDILLVAAPHAVLYHNKGNGQFEDVTEAAGLAAVKGDWTGCAIGDYDGDGYLDIVLTGYHRLALLKNVGGRRFEDTTTLAGFDAANFGHWGSSAGFMDLAGKGRLDLVLLNYVIFGPHEKQYCEIAPGIKSGCPPSVYRPEFGEIWENQGNGKFRDVSAAAGMKNTHGKALVVAFLDTDGNGRMGFYIGNDGMAAELMRNRGGMRFQNDGIKSGVAYGMLAHTMAAMGADWGDYDRDGRFDLAVSGFSNESYMVYHAAGGGLYEQASDATGLSGSTYKPLGFGTKWLDMDNDGWLDLMFANGHVYDNTDQIDPLTTFRQPIMLFHNVAKGARERQFVDLVPQMGGDVAKPLLGRGLATGDFDNDGQIDFLVVDYEGEPALFHNVSHTPNHWITLDLRTNGLNRFAYGAQITARAGKDVWVGQVSPASAYLSSSDPRVHFGLGSISTLDSLTIRWPDGKQEVLHNVAVDHILRLEEGKGIQKTQAPAAPTTAMRTSAP